MRVFPRQRIATARVLACLERGERVAERCARRQAQAVGDRALARFLGAQARQERQHALVLGAGVRWLAPKGIAEPPAAALLDRYEALLDDALARGALAESLLGQQVILEGLAEVVLERLDDGIERRGGGMRRIRHTILGQERAHHEFGVRQLDQLVAETPGAAVDLRAALPEYLGLARAMADELVELLGQFDEAPHAYVDTLHASLPGWLRTGGGAP